MYSRRIPFIDPTKYLQDYAAVNIYQLRNPKPNHYKKIPTNPTDIISLVKELIVTHYSIDCVTVKLPPSPELPTAPSPINSTPIITNTELLNTILNQQALYFQASSEATTLFFDLCGMVSQIRDSIGQPWFTR